MSLRICNFNSATLGTFKKDGGGGSVLETRFGQKGLGWYLQIQTSTFSCNTKWLKVKWWQALYYDMRIYLIIITVFVKSYSRHQCGNDFSDGFYYVKLRGVSKNSRKPRTSFLNVPIELKFSNFSKFCNTQFLLKHFLFDFFSRVILCCCFFVSPLTSLWET